MTLLVADTGGHLAELHELVTATPSLAERAIWFTPASEQASDLLSGEVVVHSPRVPPRSVRALPRAFVAGHRVLSSYSIDRVVSTGNAIAVPVFAAARMRGIPCHYIESAARVVGPSLTGRIVAWGRGVELRAQYSWQGQSRWQPAPSVFDGFRAEPWAEPDTRPLRIVVTLGTGGTYAFRRLVDAVREVVPGDAEILWQTGSTPVSDLPIRAREALPSRELGSAMRGADVVIAHAGVGSAITALQAGRFPILVPRRREHGENVDDHQVQIAHELASRDLGLHLEPHQLRPEHLVQAAGRAVHRLPAGRSELTLTRGRRW